MRNLEQTFHRIVGAQSEEDRFMALLASPLSKAPIKRHPLGFFFAKDTDSAGASLRLHVWTGTVDSTQSGYEIHDHIFDMKSFVVLGSIRQETLSLRDDALGSYQTYSVEYGSTGSRLAATGRRVELKILTQHTFSAGQKYALDAGVLHRLTALNEPAITCVLTRDRLFSATTVGPAAGPHRLDAVRTALEVERRDLTLKAASDLHELVEIIRGASRRSGERGG